MCAYAKSALCLNGSSTSARYDPGRLETPAQIAAVSSVEADLPQTLRQTVRLFQPSGGQRRVRLAEKALAVVGKNRLRVPD
jgi:hypothetical protein